jgi:DNA-binding IscR family transcriptional regulator
MDFELVVNLDEIKLIDVIQVEEGNIKALRSLLAKCMVCKDGKPMSEAKAIETLNNLSMRELRETSNQFMEAMKQVPL